MRRLYTNVLFRSKIRVIIDININDENKKFYIRNIFSQPRAQKPVTKPRRYSKIVAVVTCLKYDFLPSFEGRTDFSATACVPQVSPRPRIILPDCAVAF